jgi:uncharacterized repeat protein (TIGR01451 family)
MNRFQQSGASCSMRQALTMLLKITASIALAVFAASTTRAQCIDGGAPAGCFQTTAPTALSVYLDSNNNGVYDDGVDAPITGSTIVLEGARVFYRVQLSAGADCTFCAYRDGHIYIVTPDGNTNNVTPGTIPVIANGTCTEPIGLPPTTNSVWSTPAAYIVNLANDGTTDGDGLKNGRLQAKGLYVDGISYYDTDCEVASGSATISIAPVVPCVSVAKTVACKQANDGCQTAGEAATGYKLGAQSPSFCYSITVSNCGNKAFIVTNLTDDVIGNLLPSFLAANGSSDTLAIGQSVMISTSAVHDVTTINQVDVSGLTDTVPGIPANDSAQAEADVQLAGITCSVNATPDRLTNNTAVAVQFCVTVQNTGDAPLSGVTISDTLAPTTNINVGALAAGASNTVCYTKNFTTPECTTASVGNTVTVQGTTGGECPVVPSHDCDVTIPLDCPLPLVQIQKTVACYEGDNTCSTPFDEIAYGVKSASQCPAFCYSITITNIGPVDLAQVQVSDPDLDLSNCGFPTTLAVGGSYTCIVPAVERCASKVNTAAVFAVSAADTSKTTTDTDTAEVAIKGASITCVKEVSTNGVDYTDTLEIPGEGQPTAVWYKITVLNTSDTGVTLGNISVTDPMLVDCDITNQVPETLDSTASFEVNCVVTQTCVGPQTIGNTATVTAEVVASGSIKCVKDFNGDAITVTHSCSASVSCTPPPAEGCRTTGGGKQYTIEGQTCPTDVRYVTHGGQVGAPFGYASSPTITNCATGAGIGFWNACIRGEYEHVRHMKGGRRANFHAASNGKVHQFDSLACACLPCGSFDTSSPWANGTLTCHPVDRTYTNSGDTASVEGLCNPGDRMCGPEPRKAPANKIAFSGVGSYTDSKGKRVANSVIFRVDIEDRGEPGNAHAIGASGKDKMIDRYRIRMWKLLGDGNPDNAQNRALRVAVAVTDASDERVMAQLPCELGPTPEPFIDDGGDLDRGNRQIHPMTGAMCN